MLSGHVQGRFLSIISKLCNPKKILEIGTYTGYSAICLSEGLVENGVIHTIEINEELNSIQNKYFEKTKNTNSILRYSGNALEIIKNMETGEVKKQMFGENGHMSWEISGLSWELNITGIATPAPKSIMPPALIPPVSTPATVGLPTTTITPPPIPMGTTTVALSLIHI